MPPRILVAGIGNIFLGDDGFGPEVLRRLAGVPGADGVRCVDYGIRGLHLAYDLLDGWDALVLVDALPDRGEPGALRVFEVGGVEVEGADPESGALLDAHGMDPGAVFASLRALGGKLPRTIVVGCQAAVVDDGIGLSPDVSAALDEAVAAVHRVLERLLDLPVPAGTEG